MVREIERWARRMQQSREQESPMKSQQEKFSNMMLFCALMMVRNASATLQQSMNLVPLTGSSKHLADKLGTPTMMSKGPLSMADR